jgi:hypothetical protein
MTTLIAVYHSGLVITNVIISYEFMGMKKTFLLNEFPTLENVARNNVDDESSLSPTLPEAVDEKDGECGIVLQTELISLNLSKTRIWQHVLTCDLCFAVEEKQHKLHQPPSL